MFFFQPHLIPITIYQVVLLFVEQIALLVDEVRVICQQNLYFSIFLRDVFADSKGFYTSE